MSGMMLSGLISGLSLTGQYRSKGPLPQKGGRWGWLTPALVVLSLVAGSGCSQMRLLRSGLDAMRGGSSQTGSSFRASQTLSSTLHSGLRTNPLDGSYIEDHPINMQAGDILIAAMNSSDFDPYLALRDSSNQIIASDDDSGPDVNAFMAVRVLQSGQYTIEASSFGGGETGAYNLGYTLGSVEWQETITSRLSATSARHPGDDSLMEEHSLEARGGQALLVSMTSTEVDAYLEILDSRGEVIASNDDSGGGTDALLVIYLPDSGTYTIRANTFAAGEQGSYTLQYRLL